jgi:hypothetical protein
LSRKIDILIGSSRRNRAVQDHEDQTHEPTPGQGPKALSPERQAAIIADTYAKLRRHTDQTLAQLAIGDIAAELAELAVNAVPVRTGAYVLEDVETAARLATQADELLKASVRAARLAGKSWDSIGEAITGETGKRHAQNMINRFGDLEAKWRDALLDPVDRDLIAQPYTLYGRLPEGVSADTESTKQWLAQFLTKRGVDIELELPEETPSDRVGDYTWRLNATVEKYGVTGIPAELAADLDARKAAALAEDQAYLAAAERAAGKTTEPDEEA